MPPNDGANLEVPESVLNENSYDAEVMPPSSIVDDFENFDMEAPLLRKIGENSCAIGFDGMYEGPRFFRKFKQSVDEKNCVAEISWDERVLRYLKEHGLLKYGGGVVRG